MAKFNFNLQKVLDYRVLSEEQAKLNFGKAKAALNEQQNHVNFLQEEILSQENIRAELLSTQEHWLRTSYIKALKEDLRIANVKLTTLELKVQRCQHELIKKSQEKQLLEKLKEKQAGRYYYEEGLKEQNFFDEITTIRYTHKFE